MDNKIIIRKVGTVAKTIKVYGEDSRPNVLNGEKLVYSSDYVTVDFELSPNKIIDKMFELTKLYGKEYNDIHFRAEVVCGCYYGCTCSESLILYGSRMETDLECTFRVGIAEKKAAGAEAAERAEFAKLTRKFGGK